MRSEETERVFQIEAFSLTSTDKRKVLIYGLGLYEKKRDNNIRVKPQRVESELPIVPLFLE